MENLVFVFIIAAIAFWLGRKTKPIPSTSSDPFASSAIQSATPETPGERIPMNGQRLFQLIFITGWIIAWSAGMFFAGLFFLSTLGPNPISVFLGGWLLAAFAGWFFAARTIYKLATGKPVRGNNGQSI